MNIAEALSREIERVTDMRALLRHVINLADLETNYALNAVNKINMAIEQGHLAAGSNCAIEVLKAHSLLKSFKE